MATLWIREYSSLANARITGRGNTSGTQIVQEPGTDQTPVTYTASTQSAAFGASTTFITITSDAAFHYVVGATPTATTNAFRIPAGTLVHIGVTAGTKIAVIAAA